MTAAEQLADAYGYAAGVRKGPLSEQHRAGLTRLTSVFAKVLPAIDDEYAAQYYTRLRDMAVLTAVTERLHEEESSARKRGHSTGHG